MSQVPESIDRIAVMFVDDNPDICMLVETMLEAHGFAVQTFVSPQQALHNLADKLPDIIVSDISMPELDGYEFIKKVHQLIHTNHLPQIPAVAITGHMALADEEKSLAAGFQRHFNKPFAFQEIISTLRELVWESKKHAHEMAH